MDVESMKTILDPESLKIILALQEENTLLKRGIGDIFMMLVRKKGFSVIKYNNHVLHLLFKEVYKLYPVKNEEKQPTEKPDNADDGTQ